MTLRQVLLLSLAGGLSFSTLMWTSTIQAAEEKPARPAAVQPGHEPAGPAAQLIAKVVEFVHTLNLTDDQRAKVHEAVDNFHQEMKKFRDDHQTELQKAEQDLRAAIEAKDEQKIKDARAALQAIMQQGPRPLQLIETIRDLLTPEQREKFMAKVKELKDEFDKVRQGGPGGPGPVGPHHTPGGDGNTPPAPPPHAPH